MFKNPILKGSIFFGTALIPMVVFAEEAAPALPQSTPDILWLTLAAPGYVWLLLAAGC